MFHVEPLSDIWTWKDSPEAVSQFSTTWVIGRPEPRPTCSHCVRKKFALRRR